MSKTNKVTALVLSNVALVLFSIAGALTGTLAWFGSQQEVETTASSFAVTSLGGATYDLYYLNDFTATPVNRDGNWNSVYQEFAGYESDCANGNFTKITLDEGGHPVDEEGNVLAHNPMAINQLWPAHKLTYALVLTSGSASNFTLNSFSQTVVSSQKTGESTYVSLTWAIDMYGAAYNVTASGDAAADVATGYASYYAAMGSLTDAFDFSEAGTNPDPSSPHEIPLPIVSFSGSEPTAAQCRIFYFTIEFSNAESTFYTYNDLTGYFVKDTGGNSNCYENLQLTDLEFTIS